MKDLNEYKNNIYSDFIAENENDDSIIRTDQKYLNEIKKIEMSMYKESKKKIKNKKYKLAEEEAEGEEAYDINDVNVHTHNREIIRNINISNDFHLKEAYEPYEAEEKSKQNSKPNNYVKLSDDTFLSRKSTRNTNKSVDYNLKKLENKAYGFEIDDYYNTYEYGYNKINKRLLKNAGIDLDEINYNEELKVFQDEYYFNER